MQAATIFITKPFCAWMSSNLGSVSFQKWCIDWILTFSGERGALGGELSELNKMLGEGAIPCHPMYRAGQERNGGSMLS